MQTPSTRGLSQGDSLQTFVESRHAVNAQIQTARARVGAEKAREPMSG
jgi:hypothetical protein